MRVVLLAAAVTLHEDPGDAVATPATPGACSSTDGSAVSSFYPCSCGDATCNGNAMCDTGAHAGNGTCTSTCTDGVQSGDETGVDCGGSCGLCACSVTDGTAVSSFYPCDCSGVTCNSNTRCDTAAQTCTSTCSDGIQNGDETAVDCGGSCGPCECSVTDGSAVSSFYPCSCGAATCNGSTMCDKAAPDSSLACTSPTCTDGIQSGDETGADCGGSCDPCDEAPTAPPTTTVTEAYENGQYAKQALTADSLLLGLNADLEVGVAVHADGSLAPQLRSD